MKNITFHNLYESLKESSTVEMIENEIYICESSEIKRDKNPQPVKTDCTISCICLQGELTGKIDLIEYHVRAPGLAISEPGQILEHTSYSDDFHGIFIFMTQHFMENFKLMSGNSISKLIRDRPYIELNEEELQSIMSYWDIVKKVIRSKDDPNRLQITIHLMFAYFYGLRNFAHKPIINKERSKNEILTDKFLEVVRQNYKTERKVEYYAEQLQLTANYISHVVKEVTGKTAGQWIDDYVALEAKALLKSTNMTIQQIADDLNFPSQSFFGKFFKRVVGVAPKFYK